jgi:hypothetical protein
MKIIIFWKDKESDELVNKISLALEELWLNDFIEISQTVDEKLKERVKCSKTPALIVEEENIDFIDIIFEWIIPSDEEIRSMIVSIIWWNSTPNCATPECGVSCFC